MYTLKKSLGQHFLKDENICRKIVASLEPLSFTRLLEVGPGAGAITKYLVELPGIEFKAVELDEEKVQYLQQQYPQLKGKIIHESILDTALHFEEPFTIIGNFPYNISSQILFRVLEWKDKVQSVTGMFQKEMAQRVAAKEGSKVYGVISVLVQAYYDVEWLFDVSPQSFQPPPKVMSGVIRLIPKATIPAMKSDKDFTLLVKTAFNQRRKTLRNAVKGLFDPAILADPVFDKRAEQLSVENFASLSFSMK
jgi:16S rRNA (adenine1518-N6/adenine1519-N6)-dimethyltransferase